MCAAKLSCKHVYFGMYVSLGMFRFVMYVSSGVFHVMYVALGMLRFVCTVLFSDWYVALGVYVSFGMLFRYGCVLSLNAR
jgi:hypothetical protein